METLYFDEPIDDYKKKIFDLTTMLEIGKTLNASLSLDDVLGIIILTCNGHFHSSDSIILLSDEENDEVYTGTGTEGEKIFINSSSFIQYIRKNQQVTEVEKLSKIDNFKNIYNLFKKEGIYLIVPMCYRDKVNGILCLKQKEAEFGKGYTEDEKRYLEIIAGFASVAIENARLYKTATIDKKTRLYNHGFFQNRIMEEIERAERYHTDLALILLDLDHFKKINDTYGHLKGDEVLIKVAETIKKQVRTFDIPARFGGEEFTVLLPETDENCSYVVAERLRKSIEDLKFSNSKGTFNITASLGVSNFIHSVNMTEDILIEQADRALYQAKEKGRNRVVTYQEITEQTTS